MTINEAVQNESTSPKIKPVDFIPVYGIKTFQHRNSKALEYFHYNVSSKDRLKIIGMEAYQFVTTLTAGICAAGALLNAIEYIFNK